jgi:hypothetical protein
MTGYAMEFLAKERINERLREADQERLARAVASGSKRGRAWHARLSLGVAGRRFPVAQGVVIEGD